MIVSMILPSNKQELLDKIGSDLKRVENVKAIVLGGSHATGMANENSDLDIGIYYSEKNPFRIDEIREIANRYSKDQQPTVTNFYGWGPWVNGGAWIETESGKVDFIYRNIEQVRNTIDKALQGGWQNDFDQQPPYGFSSVIYLAETKNCIPLYDPNGIIAKLKEKVQHYPPELKNTIIQQSLWATEFSIIHAEYFSRKNDLYNTVGCITRAVKNIVNALFAINEIYPMGDNRAIEILVKSGKIPSQLKEKIETILSIDPEKLRENVSLLKDLSEESIALTNGTYRPPFQFKK